MAFGCSRLCLAAAGFAFALLLQGCVEKHVATFIEMSCKSAAEHAVDLTDSDFVKKVGEQCNSLFSSGSDGEQHCLDEAAGVFESDREAVLKNYTELCVDTFSANNTGLADVIETIKEFMNELSPNGTLAELLETHLNTTFEDVKNEFFSDLIGNDGASNNSDSAGDHTAPDSHGAHNESSDEAPHESEHEESQHHGSNHTRLFNANIRNTRLARIGSTRFPLIVCSAGGIALAAVLGFMAVRRRIRPSSASYAEQGQNVLLEEGEQSEQ